MDRPRCVSASAAKNAPPFVERTHTAILLVNLGTPQAPTTQAVRRYLAEFLSDPRVVEIPALLWKPLLYGVILRTRPRRSAEKYASIWMPEGSPLSVWTARQSQALQQAFSGSSTPNIKVDWAMRYGTPSIASRLSALCAQGVNRILIIPLYPQYAAATTASVLDAVGAWTQQTRWIPEIRWIQHYHDDEGYLDALALKVKQHWARQGKAQKLVMSFHGLPEITRTRGDPYFYECQKTAHLLTQKLSIDPADVRMTFQSRLGRAQWLQPYTEATLIDMAHKGTQSVDVICPGFACDNLETLEEIDLEARQAFLQAGGSAFHMIPCLNTDERWIGALQSLASRHLSGWI
jgi:ferrochelatase